MHPDSNPVPDPAAVPPASAQASRRTIRTRTPTSVLVRDAVRTLIAARAGHRLRTEAGTALFGRVVPDAGFDALDAAFGQASEGVAVKGMLPPSLEVASAALCDGCAFALAGGHLLRRGRIVGSRRRGRAGFPRRVVAGLKTLGLIAQIVAWHLRLYVPLDPDRDPAILRGLRPPHPVLRTRRTGAAG